MLASSLIFLSHLLTACPCGFSKRFSGQTGPISHVFRQEMTFLTGKTQDLLLYTLSVPYFSRILMFHYDDWIQKLLSNNGFQISHNMFKLLLSVLFELTHLNFQLSYEMGELRNGEIQRGTRFACQCFEYVPDSQAKNPSLFFTLCYS